MYRPMFRVHSQAVLGILVNHMGTLRPFGSPCMRKWNPHASSMDKNLAKWPNKFETIVISGCDKRMGCRIQHQGNSQRLTASCCVQRMGLKASDVCYQLLDIYSQCAIRNGSIPWSQWQINNREVTKFKYSNFSIGVYSPCHATLTSNCSDHRYQWR